MKKKKKKKKSKALDPTKFVFYGYFLIYLNTNINNN